MNEVLRKLAAERTKEVTSPHTGIVYTISPQTSAAYIAALGFVPSLKLGGGGDSNLAEMAAIMQGVCAKCTTKMKLGDVETTEIGDGSDWLSVDVTFVYGQIQKLLGVDAESAETARSLL